MEDKVEVVGVRFKDAGKIYYFDPGELTLYMGQPVIVETARGQEYGEVAMEREDVAASKVVSPLREVLRIATNDDINRVRQNRIKEKEAVAIFERKTAEHGLEMKLVDVEYTFDNSKILFYFTSDGRVDFRELVRDLASVFRIRIELRQIGVRDEARILGGLSVCGRPFCCSSFLRDFHPVSIRMAKDQGLSLNPSKISGSCGRLMCCLKYEEDAYGELIKMSPKIGSMVMTPDGEGKVIDLELLRGNVKVLIEKGDVNTVKTFHRSLLTRQKSGRRSTADSRDLEAGVRETIHPVETAVAQADIADILEDNLPEEGEQAPKKTAKFNKKRRPLRRGGRRGRLSKPGSEPPEGKQL